MWLKSGYYLSVYCCVDSLGHELTAQIRHDQNIALWYYDGDTVQLVRYWELERLTGQKHHMQPFANNDHLLYFLSSLLEQYELGLSDIVAIFGTPDIENSTEYLSLSSGYGVPIHSVCHAFSCLIDTPKLFLTNQLILAVDGAPDNLLDHGFDMYKHYTAIYFKYGEITAVDTISSPACLWGEAATLFSLPEGTLMALAEACSCCLPYEQIHLDSFISMWNTMEIRKELERICTQAEQLASNFDCRFTHSENIAAAVMKLVQEKSTGMIIEQIDYLTHKYNIDIPSTILSISGGFALNCPTNSYILKVRPFREFISPPCVNDSGQSLGLGLLFFYTHLKSSLCFQLRDAFYGGEYQDTIEKIETKYRNYIAEISDYEPQCFAGDLSIFPVCWFEGRSEIGPRALGHRSILSSAMSIDMKEKLNQLKQRQWWRPVAPIVLVDEFSDWFIGCGGSPFMLRTYQVVPEKRALIPAVLHLNDSARIQTVDKSHSLYSILLDYYKITGVPILCNTSLNDKGEPIIETIDELFNFALRKKIPIIYINRKRYRLINEDDYLEKHPAKRQNAFDSYQIAEDCLIESLIAEIDEETIDFYVNHRHLFPENSRIIDERFVDIVKEKYRELRLLHENIPN